MNKYTQPPELSFSSFWIVLKLTLLYVATINWSIYYRIQGNRLGGHAMVQLVELFALQILNEDSDNIGTPEIGQTERLFTKDIKSVSAKK